MIAVTDSSCLHLVHHGKTGALGCFVADPPLALPRGTAVVVETMRGTEVGTVLCLATGRPAQLLGPAPAGRVLRQFTQDDAEISDRQQRLGQDIFAAARLIAEERQLALEILDVEVLFDGSRAILQFLGADETGLESLADSLQQTFALGIFFENLATPQPVEEDHHGGCDKPDCGRAAGGSCTTCSTGGGCSSCGSGKAVDMTAYFGHLRGKMEQRQRTSLM